MSEESKQTELLPCTHCGSTDLSRNLWSMDQGEVDAVECNQCLAGAPLDAWSRRASPWVSMDLPPNDGQACLISSAGSDCVLMAMWRASLWFTYDTNSEPVSDVTHWMPIPEPVQEVGE